MLRLTLQKQGHEIVPARNGVEAVAFVKAEKFDLAMVDLIMPEKEGIETIREIRQLRPKLKIIAMSGGGRYTAKELLKATLRLGADKTIAKPFNTEDLENVIKATLEA